MFGQTGYRFIGYTWDLVAKSHPMRDAVKRAECGPTHYLGIASEEKIAGKKRLVSMTQPRERGLDAGEEYLESIVG